jgi:hypothetical protein
VLSNASSTLSLFAESARGWGHDDGYGYGWDYGWGWPASCRSPVAVIAGVAVSGVAGQLGFFMPAAATWGLHGRYRLVLKVDNDDGRFSQVEGIIQVRGGCGVGGASFVAPFVAPVRTVPLVFIIPGKPSGAQVYNLVLADTTTLAANFAGTVVYATTPATADAVFTVKRISGATATVIGSITVAAGAHSACTLSAQPAAVFVADDVLQLVAPAQDATLADIGITIPATRTT